MASVICPSCGSNDVSMVSEESGICMHCRSNVVINKSKPVTNVSNEVHIHTSTAGDALMIDYVVKTEIDEAEFLRKALLVLANDKDAPADIFSSQFLPVASDYRFYANVTCDVDLTYSATIGTDRKEQYQEYDSSAKKWVTKTRTVTDWYPHSGMKKSQQEAAVALDDKSENGFGATLHYIKKYAAVKADAADFEAPKALLPTQAHIESAKGSCITGAEIDAKKNLPGDHHKDFSAGGSASIVKIDNYVVPEYTMDYVYHGSPHTMHSFATNGNASWGSIVSDKKNIESTVEKRTFKFYVLTTGILLLSILISLFVRLYTLNILGFVAAVACFIFTAVYRVRTRKQIYADNAREKLKTLEKLLAAKGLAKLTDSERAEITGDKKK